MFATLSPARNIQSNFCIDYHQLSNRSQLMMLKLDMHTLIASL